MAFPENPPLHSVPPDPLRPAPPRAEPPPETETSLREYANALLDSRWLILFGAALGITLGALYWFRKPPLFQSDVLVQVERLTRGMSTLEDVPMNATEPPTETEMEIIRSRTLIASVVDALELQIEASPRRFPFIGEGIARRHDGAAPAKAWLGLSRFGWGGEHIQVKRIDLPERWEGVPFRLTALGGGQFELADPSGAVLLRGEVAKPASVRLSGPDAPADVLEIFVAQLRARPGTEFTVTRLPRLAVVGQIQGALRITERGHHTGVLQIALSGPEPRRVSATLDAIASTYLRQNVERKSEEAQKTLDFLSKQLPILKGNLDVAEGALNGYRAKRGKVDLTLEATSVLQQSVEIERRIQELEFQRTELKQRFTENHPTLMVLRQKIDKLQSDRAAIEAQIKGLPGDEVQVARLTRDVQVANNLYTLLLNRSQELKVVKSGTVGNVRILDSAVPASPVGATRSSLMALGGVLGLLLFSALALVRRAIGTGIEDPDVVEHTTGIPVYASVAQSELQAQLTRDFRRGRISTIPPLAVSEPNGLAVESLRSLRTSLAFAFADARNHVVAVTGPRPGVGKSFLALNLAHVLADTGARVLLVDGDLRNGQLHHYFGTGRSPGLAEVVAGTQPIDAILQARPKVNGVVLLPTGALPPNPAELLASSPFRNLLESMGKRYDYVVVDTPPVLAVTDAALVGRHCGVTLLVLRAGEHPPREITQTLKKLATAGIRPNGVILNGIDYRRGNARRYHYQYEYVRNGSRS
jgi:tyrosine-protein kinase Etk/Wzc